MLVVVVVIFGGVVVDLKRRESLRGFFRPGLESFLREWKKTGILGMILNQSQGEMRRWWGSNDGAGSFSKNG